jgi:multicomponent Na+:H+ antiporter subunit F
MNEWLWAAVALVALLVPCIGICALRQPIDGLLAMELGSTIATAILVLLAEGLHRQPFIDLALIFAVLSFVGSLAFARLFERRV